MANTNKPEIEELLEYLGQGDDQELDQATRGQFEQLAAEVESQDLQEAVLSKYQSFGRDLLSDAAPAMLDS